MSVTVVERPAKRDAELAGKPGVVRFLELPPRRCVAIDGEGPPGPETFAPRLPGLYTAAWSLRFALKARGVLTKVGPLEGQWWTSDGTTALGDILDDTRSGWRWTLLIVLPDEAAPAELDAALAAGRAKLAPPYDASLRIDRLDEGSVAQLLHVGSYADERPSIERLHAAVAAAGLRLHGRHHEIYLGDPSRAAPERLRTIVRHPVR
jgi:hypothetical protein